MTVAQIAAIIIFIAMFAAIISDKVHRFIPAVVGGLLTFSGLRNGTLQAITICDNAAQAAAEGKNIGPVETGQQLVPGRVC